MPQDRRSNPRTNDDRRQGARETLNIPIDYSGVDAFFGEFASNINEGGMFVETDTPPEIGELVQLQVSFPGSPRPIEIAARVAWISDGKDESPPGVGLEFQDLTDDARDAINETVMSLRSSD